MTSRERNRAKKARQLAKRKPKRRARRRMVTAEKLYRLLEPATRKLLKLSDIIGPYDAETLAGLFNRPYDGAQDATRPPVQPGVKSSG